MSVLPANQSTAPRRHRPTALVALSRTGSSRPPRLKGRRVTREWLAVAACVTGLAGMAYCHIKDVGMKFDEGVYYMAALFCCNIAASLALIPLVISSSRLAPHKARITWAAAGALAVLTIVGFTWSRTIGFPQMADHVGEWEALGITSLVFEGVVIAASAWMLGRLPVYTRVRQMQAVPWDDVSSSAGIDGRGGVRQ